ncbi:hypothetical protein U1Q18_010338 [Sarracenia purpurea var. burkii]
MSQANNKRSPYTYTSISISISTSTSGGGALFPAMKKAKSQAVACSVDNKNGLQHQPPHHIHFNTDLDAADDHLSLNIDDPNNPNDVAVDLAAGIGRAGVTANLSRKKATPPQPAKKLVIKLLKDYFHYGIKLKLSGNQNIYCMNFMRIVQFNALTLRIALGCPDGY